MRPHTKKLVTIASMLAVATFVLYFRNLLGGETFIGRDHLTLVTPTRTFLGETLTSGRLPHWWDGVGMGTAFAANPMHGTFYPLAWLCALSPDSLGSDLIIVLHVFLLGVGVAGWSLRLGATMGGATIAGIIAMSCGYTASMAVNGVPLLTLAWLPWVAWATDRLAQIAQTDTLRKRIRAALVLAAAFAMTLLSGDPAGAITAGMLAIVVTITRSEHKRLTLAYVTGSTVFAVLLASVVLLPAFYLLGESSRAGGLDFAVASDWSMHPLRLLEWIWPQALGNTAEPHLNLASVVADSSNEEFLSSGWSLSLFIGLPVLLFVATGPRSLALASLVFVILALGSYTPLYGWYRAVFLPEQVIRYPERHLAGAIILWSALSGVGFSKLLNHTPSPKTLKLWTLSALFFFVAVLAAWALTDVAVDALRDNSAPLDVDASAAWSEGLHGGFTATMCLALLVAALWIRGKKRFERYASLSYAVIVLALLWPMLRESMHAQPVIIRETLAGPPAILAPVAMRPDSEVGRPRLYRHVSVNPYLGQADSATIFASQYHTAFPNTATAHGFAYVPGYDAALSTRMMDTWKYSDQFGGRLLKLYDIEFVYLPQKTALANDLEPVHSVLAPHLVLARQSDRRPRAFVAQRWKRVATQEDVFKTLFANTIDLGSVTLIGAQTDLPTIQTTGEPEPCQMVSEVPERVTLHCTSSHGGYAVLLDTWAPGWSATVDGEPATIEVADAIVRAVRISEGTHTIVFQYKTPGFATGLTLSLFAWMLFLLGIVVTRQRPTDSAVLP